MDDGGVGMRKIVIINGTAFWIRRREISFAGEELKQQRYVLEAFLGQ